MRIFVLFVGHFFFVQLFCLAQNESTISSSDLNKDFDLLKQVFLSVHPGLYRYNSKQAMDQHFKVLESQWKVGSTEKVALKQLAQFLEKVKCGHTCINPYNLQDSLRDTIYPVNEFLPLFFTVIQGKLFITGNATNNKNISIGDQIISINGINYSTILDSLSTAVKSDGQSNLETKYKLLEISNVEQFSNFDMLFPLFFKSGREFSLVLSNLYGDKKAPIRVNGMSVTDRQRFIEEKSNYKKDNKQWSLRDLGPSTKLLVMPNWFTYTFKEDWEKTLNTYFESINASGAKNLVIDLRNNVGGDGNVTNELLSYISNQDILPNVFYKQIQSNNYIDKKFWPFFLPWGEAYKDVLAPNRYKRLLDGRCQLIDLKVDTTFMKKNRFLGKVYILVNAANSSATFNFIDYVKEHRLGIIIGQKTGGNMQGINSNSFVFLRLPSTKLRIDIPLVFNDPGYKRPEGGISPDYVVYPTQADIAHQKDSQLLYVMALINSQSR